MPSSDLLALVLKKIPYRDKDSILTFLTSDDEILSAYAGSERSSSKRFGPVLDVTNIVYLQMAPVHKGGLHTLKSAECKQGFLSLRTDLLRLTMVSVVLEMVTHFMCDQQKVTGVFNLVAEFLQEANDASVFSETLLLKAELKLLTLFGFRPHLENCILCSAESSRYTFSMDRGGLLCNTCSQLTRNSVFFEQPLVTAWREGELNSHFSLQDVRLCRRTLEKFAMLHSGRTSHALDFFETLL